MQQKKQRINVVLNLSIIRLFLDRLSSWETILRNLHKSNFWVSLIAILTLTQLMNSYAEDNSLKDALNDHALFTLLHHKNAQTGSLEVVSVAESQEKTLNGKDRIVGYPIVGKLKNLDREKSFQLANILLDKNNYSNIRQRCINQTLNGVRFSVGDEKVEVVIGSPCNQVFAAFKYKNETKWWGSTLGDTVAKKALKLLCVGDLN